MHRFAQTTGLILLVVFALSLPAQGSLSGAEERVFLSGDIDKDPDSVSGDLSDGGKTFAKIGDLTFRTSRPQYEISDTKLHEYQRNSLSRLDTNVRHSRTMPQSDQRNTALIKNAHVTLLGIYGGAQPQFSSGSSPMFIGADGTVLNHADYRVPEDIPKDDWCSGKSYDTADWDVDKDGRDEEVYLDGSQTCKKYELHTKMDRWVTVDGKRISGGDTISYSGLSSNSPQQLTVHAEITVRVERITEKYDWDPHGRYGGGPSDGSWDQSQRVDDRYRFDRIQVSDSQEVVVTDAGDIDVEQTVVETEGNTKHLILEIQGPRNGRTVSQSKLEDRKLWSYLAMGSDHSVDGTWRTYSTRQYDSVTLYEPDGDVSTDPSPPHVPQTRLVGTDRKPTVTAVGSSSDKTQVIGHQGYNVDVSQSLHANVKITPRQPVAYERIVITDAKQPVTDLVTIHGQPVPVDVDTRVERRKPSVTIRQVNSGDSLQIHVEDPKTGQPISGRKVNLQGAVPKSPTASGNAVTDANGNVEATRVNAYVQATVDHDDFQSISNGAFYDKSSAERTFIPDVILLSRLHSLVLTLALITPLLFLYGYIRHFGFFE